MPSPESSGGSSRTQTFSVSSSRPESPDEQPPVDEATLGQLVARASHDLSMLLHKEIELAKVELLSSAKAAGLGAGLLGGAGLMAYFGGIFLSIALAFGIGYFLGLGYGFLIVGGAYLLLGGLLALIGKKAVSAAGPPRRSIRSVKTDIAWVKQPRNVPGGQ